MKQETANQHIKYDIANALYIISPKLGEKYEREKESPFDDNFVLTEAFAKEILDGAKNKSKVEQPDFLKQGNKEVSAHFNKSLIATSEVIDMLTQRLYSGEFALGVEDNLEDKIKQTIDILKVRKKMLVNAIAELKNSKTDSFALYKDIVSISKNVSEILKESFEEEIDKQIVIEQIIKQIKEAEKLRKIQTALNNSKINENAQILPEKQIDKTINNDYIKVPEYVANKESYMDNISPQNEVNDENLTI